MRTEVIDSAAIESPWLEYFPPHSSNLERFSLVQLPMIIGRSDTADFTVDSTRVSREHAMIERRGRALVLRDLGSTNGTFVNGSQVDQVELQAGDMFSVADMEFTFYEPRKRSNQNATQVMETSLDALSNTLHPGDAMIQQVRRMQEGFVSGSTRCAFLNVVDLQSTHCVGYEAARINELPLGLLGPAMDSALLGSECRLASRFRQMQRQRAVEEAFSMHADSRVYLPLDASEVGDETLIDFFTRLSAQTSNSSRLALLIPDSAVCDIPYFRNFLATMRDLGFAVGYDEFSGGRQQFVQHRTIAPDFLKLSRSFVRDIHQAPARLRQLDEIVSETSELECHIFVTGVRSPEEAQACQEAGCQLAQGSHFGGPASLRELSKLSEANAS